MQFELTSCGAEPATASFAFEVLGFLVVDQDLEIIKVSLAVVTPGTGEDLLDVRVIALLLRHCAGS